MITRSIQRRQAVGPVDRTNESPKRQKKGGLSMESNAPPDNLSPLCAGEIFSGPNAGLTR